MSVSFPGSVDDKSNIQNSDHSQVDDIIYDIKSYNTSLSSTKGQEAQTKGDAAPTAGRTPPQASWSVGDQL